ncbi:MAG: hypothetical protein H6657_00725 [Ardenticatenaceae bacterium]|nr:hypothetical protein [Ardenticatenaceae bacterium]
MRKLMVFWGLILILAACGGEAETAPSASSGQAIPPKAEQIICTAAYRSSVEVGIEREETLTFSDVDDEQSIAFADMTFHAAYRTGAADNERNLRVWVTDAADTAVYHTTLFQLVPNSGPQDQFVGGHGFTGLNYSYAPDSTAELQYWCAVEAAGQ